MELGKTIQKLSPLKTDASAKPGASVKPAATGKQGTHVKTPTNVMPMPLPAPVKPEVTAPAAPNKMEMKHWCNQHMHRYVLARTYNGWCTDGIVEHIDDEFVCLAVPCGVMMVDSRGFGPFSPFGGPFGGPFGAPFYPYPYYPRRRFIRQTLPLAALVGLSLLPFY
ncbi:hypothetical protein PaecuDRAFT_0268 [Paenibacillus curdlanolyticus YK9]|uniref:Uncharacterized protein n=1 Tax=Paenibacillus curdlanolyticus YK9 TaxID=717606 RepID=E0I393_9BACL|nr:hypothetical protein [Paenibacillus curdlanolyticus]EFM12757.1 hypothetical protein PaecuDRAFT_0268 [Paenibacillus curdlanolyticus YK9]